MCVGGGVNAVGSFSNALEFYLHTFEKGYFNMDGTKMHSMQKFSKTNLST